MTSPIKLVQIAEKSLITEFFQESVGKWSSQRRYYTLPDGKTKEVASTITIRFLEGGCDQLQKLAQMHNFDVSTMLSCGAEVYWESENVLTKAKESQGSTLFGALGNKLYRDRGFATSKPITAEYYFPNVKTLCLRTEYNGSVFEEELKFISEKYRTRQSVMSRSGEQVMIGQYLEKRIEG
ncbi:MAG: phycobiliprotein lyase [Cyanobacteria bacterium P01_D01_bin.50]